MQKFSELFVSLRSRLGAIARREEGQGMVEYALILVLIAIVVIAVLTLVGGHVSDTFSSVNSAL